MSTPEKIHRSERPSKKLMASLLGTTALSVLGLYNIHQIRELQELHRDSLRVESAQSDDISDIATKMAGKALRVHCGDIFFTQDSISEGYEGSAFVRAYIVSLPLMDDLYIPNDDIYIRDEACSFIQETTKDGLFKNATNPILSAYHLQTLSHEIEHTNGVFDEAEAECYALQRLPSRLREAGYSRAEIRFVVEIAKDDRQRNILEEYSSGECEPSGEYDLGIDGPFPEW